MHHNLDLYEGIAIITDAVLHRRLQAQQFHGAVTCLYAGPCAIGVLIPEADRSYFDNTDDDAGFPTWFEKHELTCDSRQYEDFKLLQELHDSLASKRLALTNHIACRDTALQVVDEEQYNRGEVALRQSLHDARRNFFRFIRELQETYAHV